MTAELKSYAYEAQSADGRAFKGTLEAASSEDVCARLAVLQLRVMTVAPAQDATPRGRPLNTDDFQVFNQQLAHLTQAGLPVEHGLRLIAADIRSGRLARAADDVAAELERGVPLQQAFGAHATRFPPLYGKLVEAGALSGNLPGMLFNLGRHLELVARLRQSLWRTASYPLMVLAALALVLLLVSLFVLPHFQAMFDSMYSNFRMVESLPLTTRILMALGGIYPAFLAVVVAILILVFGGDAIARLSGLRGIPWTSLLRYVPLIGGVIRASLLARWIDALRLGIESGLDLPRAITLASDSVAARGGLALDSQTLVASLAQGQTLAGFRGKFIPATVPAAIELGSATADLPAVLRTLTRMYEEHAEQRLRLLPTVLTPLMMIFVGGAIAATISALFLPFATLLRLVQSVSGGM